MMRGIFTLLEYGSGKSALRKELSARCLAARLFWVTWNGLRTKEQDERKTCDEEGRDLECRESEKMQRQAVQRDRKAKAVSDDVTLPPTDQRLGVLRQSLQRGFHRQNLNPPHHEDDYHDRNRHHGECPQENRFRRRGGREPQNYEGVNCDSSGKNESDYLDESTCCFHKLQSHGRHFTKSPK